MFISMLEHHKNITRRFEVGYAPLSIMLLFRSVLNEIFEVSNYIAITIKERFQQIGYQKQLETHLIKKM